MNLPALSSIPIVKPAVLAALLLSALPAVGQGTRLWMQSRMDEFEKGSARAVAIQSDGRMRQGPAAAEVAVTPSTFVWTVAAGKDGTAYVGTAAPASVLRIGADGKVTTLFETKEVSVPVVRIGPDGALYAATLPGGKVYRLDPKATAKSDEKSAALVFDLAAAAKSEGAKEQSGSRYVWAMEFDQAGKLFIATGGPGAIYRVDPAKPAAQPELFFQSDEAHIRSLAWDGKGNLIAGSDGSGLVYRVGPDGKGYVLFDAPRREITAVAVGADGAIYAASVGDRSRNPLPNLPVQPGSASTLVQSPPSAGPLNQSSTLPEGTELYVLRDNQAPRRLWSSKDDIVYALVSRPDGLLALTGNRGRLFRIAPDGSYADLAQLEAQQALCLAEGVNGTLLIGTGSTGKLVRLGGEAAHEFASDVFDAGSLARFGRVELAPGARNAQILTRTGNVAQPVRGWSPWQPLSAGRVASPAGRYLQWKAVLGADGELAAVGVNYLTVNAAPVVDDVIAVPGARYSPSNSASSAQTVSITFSPSGQSGKAGTDSSANSPLMAAKEKNAVTVRWAAHDDNGDDLLSSLYLRGDGEKSWRLLKNEIAEKAYSFDAATLPDGGYQIRVVASDAPSHTPADALTDDKVSARFELDTTAPVVSALKAEPEAAKCAPGAACKRAFKVAFVAEDAASPVVRAEYSLDAGPWQFLEPVGKLSDSLRESYEFRVSFDTPEGKLSEHLVTVRAFDRQENAGVAKTVIAGDEK